VRNDLVRATRAVSDPPVERLDPETPERAAGYERVETPPQAINLHDVTCLDAFQSHHLSA
jgi:hypothetical protein